MATSTLTEIAREAAQKLYPGRVVTGTTTSSVDTASVLDTANLGDDNANANQYDNVFVRIDEFVTSGPDVGEFQKVSSYAGGTGDLTTSAFADTVQTGTDFSLHYALRPTELDSIANLVLSNLHHETYHPLSVLTNHDWENATSGTPDSWTASGGGSQTLTQTATAAYVPYGRYSALNDNADVADGYYYNTTPINVNEGQGFYIWAPVMTVGTSTATLNAYDTSNGSSIETAATVQRRATELAFTFTIPSACELLSIRLQGTGATDSAYWGPVVLYPTGRTIFDLPSWMDTESDLTGAFYFPLGSGSGGSSEDNAYRAFEREPIPLPFRKMFDPLQANPNRIELDASQANGPIFLKGWRPFAELTNPVGNATADTTLADRDTVVAGVVAEAHNRIAKRLGDSDSARKHVHWANDAKREFEALKESMGYALTIPQTKTKRPRMVSVRLT